MCSTLLVLLAVLPAAPAPETDAARQDREKMQGTWKAVSVESGGKKKPDEAIKNWKLTIDGSRMTARDGDELLEESTFTLDAGKKPRAIEIRYTAGPDKGKKLTGIYLLEKDTLKICVTLQEKNGPTEFVSRPDTDHTLVTMKKE
jgi:RNA polymerase sigma-70 factor (ECF subfamily)